jgi:hypothetical protein
MCFNVDINLFPFSMSKIPRNEMKFFSRNAKTHTISVDWDGVLLQSEV